MTVPHCLVLYRFFSGLAPSTIYVPRWTSKGGKFDRCQLGHAAQLQRIKDLEEAIKAAVFESTGKTETVETMQAHRQDTEIKAVIESCLKVLGAAHPQEYREVAISSLLCVAKFDYRVAHIIRLSGYNTRHKFPPNFDLESACRKTFFLLSPFLQHLQASLKRGNNANIEAGSTTAWQAVLKQDLAWCEDASCVKDVLEKDDIMDAGGIAARVEEELATLLKEAKKKPHPVQTGRPVTTKNKKLQLLKRKLSEMSLSTDSSAGDALRKMEQNEKDEARDHKHEVDIRKGGGKQKKAIRRKKTKPVKDKYKRQAGDELRLLKKREIVSRL